MIVRLLVTAIFASVIVLAAGQTYEDDRIRVNFPSDLIAAHPAHLVTILGAGNKVKTESVQIPGVRLSKDKFRVDLLTHNNQASGIKGGRFSEIAQFVAPWMKVTGPSGCIEAFTTSVNPVTNQLVRVDLFLDSRVSNQAYEPECRHFHSTTRIPVWSGSYFGWRDPAFRLPGYFLTFPMGTENHGNNQMVFAATFETKNAETLPSKDNRDLLDFLREASEVVRNVHFRIPSS